MRLRPPDFTRTYRGRYPCPKCASRETGTDTIASSERWIVFACDTCGHLFRKSASGVSSLSRRFAGLSERLHQEGH